MKADRIWESLPCDEAQAAILARELGVSAVTARLLASRGLGLEEARRFLAPRLEDFHDPLRLIFAPRIAPVATATTTPTWPNPPGFPLPEKGVDRRRGVYE